MNGTFGISYNVTDPFASFSGARAASEQRDCVKKSSFQSQPDSIRSDDESEYTYEEEDEEDEDLKDQSEKLEPDSSYEAQAEKILEDPNVSKEVSPDLVKDQTIEMDHGGLYNRRDTPIGISVQDPPSYSVLYSPSKKIPNYNDTAFLFLANSLQYSNIKFYVCVMI